MKTYEKLFGRLNMVRTKLAKVGYVLKIGTGCQLLQIYKVCIKWDKKIITRYEKISL